MLSVTPLLGVSYIRVENNEEVSYTRLWHFASSLADHLYGGKPQAPRANE